MRIILTVMLVLMTATAGYGKIITQPVHYQQNDTILEGYLAYDNAVSGKRPGVLVVHEFWGLNDFARQKAEEVAKMGYVALAVDMYGQGKVTRDPEKARRWADHVKSSPLMRERAQAGLQVLAKHDLVDAKRLAAIGFCFGGTTVLELAYSGADLRGVASFHGGLTVPQPEEMKNIKASLLVLHGADDPHVKAEAVDAFLKAMRQAGGDWQMIFFGNTVHSFTNPAAGSDPSQGVAYNPKTTARSWKYLRIFLEEVFSQTKPQ
ncbi:MAG: dienelactone hydrolase family protein [Thermodesulfobacteriota bacterium]